MTHLKRSEYLDIGDNLEYGQKIRVNHSTPSCSGESKSLLVEKKHDGSIVAYCFRCGRRGYHGSKSALKSKIVGDCDSFPVTSHTGYGELPGDSELLLEEWSSPKARIWIQKYGITAAEVSEYGICYSPSLRRILLPIWNEDGNLALYQSRKVFDDDQGPKYSTYKYDDYAPIFNLSGSVLVIVEDMLSAIKVGRQYAAMPLFSTNIREVHLKFLISKGFTTFVLWLDDDNLEVRKQTLKNHKLLNKLGKCYVVHSRGKDPKDHTDTEIKDIIENILM